MAIFTAQQLLAKHGVTPDQVTASKAPTTTIPNPESSQSGLLGRIADNAVNNFQSSRATLDATKADPNGNVGSDFTALTSAVASNARTIPDTVAEAIKALPGGDYVLTSVGDFLGQAFDAAQKKLSETSIIKDAAGNEVTMPDGTTQYVPNPATAPLENVLETVANIGDTAGSLSTLEGIPKTGAGARAIATKIADNVPTLPKASEVFGSLRPTAEQIAKERSVKIAKGFEEQNTRLKSADSSFNDNTIVRKGPDGQTTTITPIDTFTNEGIAPVIEKGSIQMGDWKTETGALGQLKEKVSKIDQEIDTKLKNTGEKISIADLEKSAIEEAQANPDLRRLGNVDSTVKKLQIKFADYRSSYGDTIDIAELNHIRKTANKDYNPETMDTSRLIGDVARNHVYDAVPDQEIKTLLQKQGEYLAAKKYAEKINGTKVSGGKLGNYAMRTAGAVMGSTIEKAPVLGPTLGMLGGEMVARGMQQTQFKSAWTELRALLAKPDFETSQTTPSQVTKQK